MTREEDVSKKLELLRDYMDFRNADGVVLSRVDNFAWLTSGGRSYISITDQTGSASVLVTKDEAYVISKNMEAERLKNEELTSNLKVLGFSWFERMDGAVSKIVDGKRLLYEDEPDFSDFLLRNRVRLSGYERKRFGEVGRRTSKALERAVRKFTPEMTEFQAKAVVESELTCEKLEVPLVLVFADESRKLYRHNLPREVRIGRRAFASVCAKMYGLVVSATRTVEFGSDEAFEDQYATNIRIDAEILDSTLKSNSTARIFHYIEETYEKNGYPNEWMLHHQGGVAGYNNREVVATPHVSFPAESGMAFAWNPTVTGTKSEDTYLKTDEGMKLLSFDSDGDWPYVEISIEGRKYRRPDILRL